MRTAMRAVRRRTAKALVGFERIVHTLEGTIRGNKIKAYWYTTVANFGDLITPLLLRYYGFTPVHCPIEQADLLSTGSILQSVPDDWSGHILGSGLIWNTRRSMGNARIWAVRGELTRKAIGAPHATVLGDPGLLSSKLLRRRMKRRYALGIVPHYVDREDPRLSRIAERYGSDVLLIDVMRDPLTVLGDVDSCNAILSSSLHGIVAADSLGIPSGWIYLSDDVVGGGFKFHDYFSAFGEKADPVGLKGDESLSKLLTYPTPPSKMVGAIAHKLDASFRALRRSIAAA